VVRKITLAAVLLSMVVAGCGTSPSEAAGGETPSTSNPAPGDCSPAAVTQPLMPDSIPGYTEIDPSTGLHMTGTPMLIEVDGWRLEVTGKVDHPLSLTYDQLRCLPRVEAAPELICPGFFTDHATWAGAPLSAILAMAGVQEDASVIYLEAADGYFARIQLNDEALADGFLAYELEGRPLPVLHGFPVRAVFPGKQGNTWVKWLIEIEVR
jgi:DMSO/TMAO reductase YedYZ molybdopterin-dependent catalytic subunit